MLSIIVWLPGTTGYNLLHELLMRKEQVILYFIQVGIDMVSDAVNKSLSEEMKEIKRVQKVMNQHLEDVLSQIQVNYSYMGILYYNLQLLDQ